MIETKVSDIGSSHTCVDFVIGKSEINEALSNAEAQVNRLKRRPLGEKQLGLNPAETERNAILTRATKSVVETAVRNAICENGIQLTSNPKIEITELVSEDSPFCFSILLETVPHLSLSSYDDIIVPIREKLSVSEEDIDAQLDMIRRRAAEVQTESPLPIGENDVVELSFTSFIDGESYEGSTAKGYSYRMGSEQLPYEFERGLLGLHTGDKKSIAFCIPNDFDNTNIAGKQARFEVEIGRVASYRLPCLNDKFAQEFGYQDLITWREKIRRELEAQQESSARDHREAAARAVLADRLDGEVDESLIDAQSRKMLEAFKLELKSGGTDIKEYCRFIGISENDILKEMREESATLVRENLALEALFRALKLNASEDEARQTFSLLAQEGGMPPGTIFEELDEAQKAAIREMTMHRMATDWLLEHATFSYN